VNYCNKTGNGHPSSILLVQSICSIWCHSLTDLTIDIFGEHHDKDANYGTITDHIEALTSLRVIERLTLANYNYPHHPMARRFTLIMWACLNDNDLMTLSTHFKLPATLTDVSWKWNRSSRRSDAHNNVRQSFASRGIMCHDIGSEWQASPL
jgi:hypothetical protein